MPSSVAGDGLKAVPYADVLAGRIGIFHGDVVEKKGRQDAKDDHHENTRQGVLR